MVLYYNITMVINVLVILSCLCAGLAICKVIKCLRAFVETNVPQTAGLHSPSYASTKFFQETNAFSLGIFLSVTALDPVFLHLRNL